MTRHLNRKLLRDVRHYWPQFVAVLLMSLLSVLIYTGLEGAWNGLRTQLSSYAEDTTLADVWVQTTGSTPAEVDALTQTPQIEAAEGVALMSATDTDGGFLEVELLTSRGATLSTPTVVDGAEMSTAQPGVWLGEPYASAHDYEVGDVLTLTVAGRPVELEVLGIYFSPEKLYFTGSPSLVAPHPTLYGYASAPATALGLDETAPATLVRVRADDPAAAQTAAIDALGDAVVRATDRASNLAVSTAFDRVDQIRNLSVLFSSIFVLLAILAMYTSTRRLVDMQDREIATLKALGIPRRTIALHFSMYGLVAGGVGGLLGIAIAPAMSTFVLGTQQTMLSMPSWGIAYTPIPLAVLALVVAVCVGGAYLAARPAMRAIPAEQLRPGVARGRRIALERVAPLWRRTGYGSRWAWRDSGTNKTRFVMGVVAVGGSIMLLFAGFGMPDSMQGQVVSAFQEENTYTARVALSGAGALDDAEVGDRPQEVQELVVRTDPADGFDRVLTVLGPGGHVHLMTVDGHEADPARISVTSATAERLGLGVGDVVAVTLPAGGGSRELAVEQLVTGSAPQGLYVSRERWEEIGEQFRATTVLVDGSADLDALRSSPAVTSVMTLQEQYDNADEMVTDLGGIFMLIRVFAILLTVIVLYSLGSLAFTERVRDYATLKVLGLSTGDLRRLAARENVVATLLGIVIGIPAGHLFLRAYVGTFSTPRLEYTSQISTVSIVLACAIAVAFSLATTFLLGRRLRAIDCASALKGVE